MGRVWGRVRVSFTNPPALSAVTRIPDPLLSPFLIARKLENQLTLLAAAGGSEPVCAILLQRTGKFTSLLLD